jgi:hypothetical protein
MSADKKTRREIAGDTILDLGKLSFAGLVLAGIFDTNMNAILLVICAVVFSITLIILGIYLITKK